MSGPRIDVVIGWRRGRLFYVTCASNPTLTFVVGVVQLTRIQLRAFCWLKIQSSVGGRRNKGTL